MRKKLALLSLLLLVSAGSAVVASALGTSRILAGKVDFKIDVNEMLMFTKLSPEQREKAIDMALGDPQVREILEGVDDYRTSVSEIFDIQKIEGGIALIPKEEFALVELRIYKDYGEEFGLQVVKVTVDLSEEKVKEIEKYPEVRKPKIHEDVISTDELLTNPSKYHGQVVRVSGVVSDLGLLRGPYFRLDGKLTICYYWDETNIYPTQIKDKIQNGDHVVVTGRFLGELHPYIVYAEEVEKVTS
jgi:hypothetical protein